MYWQLVASYSTLNSTQFFSEIFQEITFDHVVFEHVVSAE